MSKIAVFYHVFKTRNWREIYTEQVNLLHESGLYDAADELFVNFIGPERQDQPVPPKFNVLSGGATARNECETLNHLREYKAEAKILYFHTKGVSRSDHRENIHDWRKYMEYFNIEQWQQCVELLDNYDTVGVDLRKGVEQGRPYKAYAGNFWWINSNVLPRLPILSPHDRMNAEFWFTDIGLRMYCMHQSNINNYLESYPRSMYKTQKNCNT